MALSIGQMAALSYNDVLKVKNLPENQWAENAAMRWLEKNGYIKRRNLGPQIEIPLDYRINPNAEFLDTDLQEVGVRVEIGRASCRERV